MADPTYKSGVGRLAVDRYDFQEHIDGYAFKHKAVGILTDPIYSQFDNAPDLQGILGSLAAFVDEQTAAGQGFVTFGDGLDTWHAADGNINYDNAIPAIDTVLNPIFSAIYNNTTLAPEYERLRFGGIVLIKAGTYIVRDTIEVPPGISIIGEGWGTKIINAIRLDITTSPPTRDLGTTAKPVFLVKADPNRSINDAAVDPDMFAFTRATKFMNLVIADNFVENTILGDIFYKLPQNIVGDNPLIKQEAGSNLELNGVHFLGRANFSSGKIVNEATRFAIQLDNSTAVTTGTHLTLDTCFIDGFSQPVQFESIGGVQDYLSIKNCKIRAHGYLDGDGSTIENNCVVRMNDNNISMVGNEVFGNHDALLVLVYVASALTPPLDENNKPKILISANNFIVDRGSATPVTPAWLGVESSINVTFRANSDMMIFGNNYNSNYGFYLDVGGSQMTVSENGANINTPGNFSVTGASGVTLVGNSGMSFQMGSSQLLINAGLMNLMGGFYFQTATHVGDGVTSFNVGVSDYIIFCDTTAGALTINLPSAGTGRCLVIKDVGGAAATNPITLARFGGTGIIEGVAADLVLNTNYGALQIISRTDDWYII